MGERVLEIRELKNCEIDDIMRIWLESTIEAHCFIEEEYWKKNYEVVRDMYIPMAKTFVYYDEEKIKGFISVIDSNFIGALFVHTKNQGSGIGKSLVEYVKNKYENIELAVYKDNKKAVEFYKKEGFKIIKEQENEDSGHLEYLMSYSKNRSKNQ
ncbi:N-acetyltransferase [Clostridium perfringens]|uniref:N-acetyltransferase n=1 Tax=Clostridium perfringens TaxID=1502 RepID=UPI0018E46BC6|nr:N-acetyltransferase [Clostridium perfringens]MBI6039088.1 N-acetyltransferase [Clostridium perfringens]